MRVSDLSCRRRKHVNVDDGMREYEGVRGYLTCPVAPPGSRKKHPLAKEMLATNADTNEPTTNNGNDDDDDEDTSMPLPSSLGLRREGRKDTFTNCIFSL